MGPLAVAETCSPRDYPFENELLYFGISIRTNGRKENNTNNIDLDPSCMVVVVLFSKKHKTWCLCH